MNTVSRATASAIALSLALTLAIWASMTATAQPGAQEKATSPTQAAGKSQAEPKTEADKVSYCIGANMGRSLKQSGLEINPDILVQAIKDVLEGRQPAMSEEQMQETMKNAQKQASEKRQGRLQEEGKKREPENKAFLEKIAKEPGVVTLPSGLRYKVLKEGTGASPKATDTVKVHYRGTLIDGTEFDSSYKRGEPAPLALNKVIAGWTEALQLMKEGAKWQLYIPPDLAYGAEGRPGIPPNALLIFEVELIEVSK